MKLENIDIDDTLKEVEYLLSQEKNLSPTLHAMVKLLITLLKLSSNRMGLTSRNSSKPPSTDPNRLKPTRKKSVKKIGEKNRRSTRSRGNDTETN